MGETYAKGMIALTQMSAEPRERITLTDWSAVAEDMNATGCALTGPLLTEAGCRDIASLYDQPERFRSTIDMERFRFGQGQYRYFTRPFPVLVGELRQALYPRLLPVARDWAAKLGRPAPWPDTLDAWLDMCHRAGQDKPTPILLRYQAGDWNALHRDLYGDRPVRSARGWTAAPVRHGVSTVERGPRHTLGLVFHDAA